MRVPNPIALSANSTGRDSGTSSRRLRILCAEDDVFLGGILVQIFSRAGHSALHVPNGVEAWERLSKALGEFDVVVTDHDMPGLNGLKLVELLRASSFCGRIVLYTSGVTQPEFASYQRLGVAAIITKAPHPAELLKAVELG